MSSPPASEAPFSEAGNAWVAEALRARLHRLPTVAAMLVGAPHT